MIRLFLFAFSALVALAPGIASAHTGAGAGFGFTAGLVHPFGGLDHLLAMVAFGFWAAQLGGRARWGVPAAFVAVMALSGGLAMAGLAIPFKEWGIAASVLVLGLAIAFRWNLTIATVMALVGAFAAFHGFAHGAEVPVAATPALYALGFVAATAALHGIGLSLGAMTRSVWAVRLGGAATAAAGAVLLIAA